MNSKSLVSISDIGRDEIMSLLDMARRFEENPNRRLLEGRRNSLFRAVDAHASEF